MNEYLNMWKNFANFSDRTTVRGFWMAYLINIIVAFALGIILAIPFGILSALTDSGFLAIVPSIFVSIYGVAMLIPSIAMIIRRLRDSGKEWYYILFNFVPCVGSIILIIFLCQPSVPDNGTPVV